MRHVVSLADLTKMDQPRKDGTLDALVRRAKSGNSNDSLAMLDAEILAFEVRHEMSSEVMLARFKSGQQPDTADISRWFLLLSVRERAQAAEANRKSVLNELAAEAEKLGLY